MRPDANLRFILRPRGIGLQRALPPAPKPFTIVETRELMAKVMALFEMGAAGERYAEGTAALRDAALLGLLAGHAPRLGSIASMRMAEGEISELHIGLKVTMGALFLKDLADKTRRGLEGRIRAGRSAGTVPYGYRMVRQLRPDGEIDRGLREADPAEAVVVRRIFAEYAAGRSPRAIARDLNGQGVPGPGGGPWCDSSIRGRSRRADGILRNQAYIGRLVWNRTRSLKDPASGEVRQRPRAAPGPGAGRAPDRQPRGRHRGRPAVARAAGEAGWAGSPPGGHRVCCRSGGSSSTGAPSEPGRGLPDARGHPPGRLVGQRRPRRPGGRESPDRPRHRPPAWRTR